MSEEGAKPEARSRRITVMGRRRSRAPDDTGEGGVEGGEGAEGEQGEESVELQPDSHATQELLPGDVVEPDTAANEDDTEKTNPRARADEIAAALSRLTPEPEDVRTNPRIVIEAVSGAPRMTDEPARRPAVVIAQAQI